MSVHDPRIIWDSASALAFIKSFRSKAIDDAIAKGNAADDPDAADADKDSNARDVRATHDSAQRSPCSRSRSRR